MKKRIIKKHNNRWLPSCKYCKQKIHNVFRFASEIFPYPYSDRDDLYVFRGFFQCKKCKRKNYFFVKTVLDQDGYQRLKKQIEEKSNGQEEV